MKLGVRALLKSDIGAGCSRCWQCQILSLACLQVSLHHKHRAKPAELKDHPQSSIVEFCVLQAVQVDFKTSLCLTR